MPHWAMYAMLVVTALIAGIQNALAGGGSFITFPALLFFGMGARAANITSTIALFPGQLTTGLAGRAHVSGAEGLSFKALGGISLVGGVIGALLLLATPESFFRRRIAGISRRCRPRSRSSPSRFTAAISAAASAF
jgi:uncharacterized membrane protein YfcA